MSMRFANNKLTLCEVLRLINDRVQKDDQTNSEIRDLLALAEHMAKRMSAKLREYSEADDPDNWWGNNPLYKENTIREENTYKIGSKERAIEILKEMQGICG